MVVAVCRLSATEGHDVYQLQIPLHRSTYCLLLYHGAGDSYEHEQTERVVVF